MRFLSAPYKEIDRGFTLLEIIIVMAIIAILGGISAPSFINLYNVNKVNDAINKAKGAIQEAQNQAIRYGKQCKLNILNVGDTTSSGAAAEAPTIEVSPSGAAPAASDPKQESCLVNGDRVLRGIKLSGKPTPWTISFDSKGRTSSASFNPNSTMILSIPDVSKPSKCIVVSQGLGLIRSGDYIESATPKCQTSR